MNAAHFGRHNGLDARSQGNGATATLPSPAPTVPNKEYTGVPNKEYTGFAFKKKQSIQAGIRRLLSKRIERASEQIRSHPAPEAVHGVRTEIKKLRSLLRLVRTELGGKAYENQTRLLREIALQLAGTRDAQVRLQAFDKLVEHFGPQLPGPFTHVRQAFEQASHAQGRQLLDNKSPKRINRTLDHLACEACKVKIEGKGWAALEPGIKVNYRRGRDARQTAATDPTPIHLHNWRKRVKELWYHARLLTPVWPEYFVPVCDLLKTLEETLGDDHDLELVKEGLTADIPAAEVETLMPFIERRQSDLRKTALSLGARVYAEKPGAFTRRIRTYWETWRGEVS